jgi:chaperonin GroES
VGEGRRSEDGTRIPLDVQAGDQILFAKYGGTEFTLDEEELLILSEKDILAVVAS